MDSLRQPKFSQASVWFPSWFHPMLLSGTNGASTPSLFFDSQDDMAIASSRFGHRGITLNLEESSCFDGNEMREHKKPGLFTDSAKGFNVGTASVTCIPRKDCCFTNLFKSSDEMSISYSQLNEPNVLLSETITELCILNTDCSQERLKTGPVPFPVDSKLVNIHSPIDIPSQQTSSTELYEAPVVSGGHEVISAHPSMKLHPYIGDVNEKQGCLMLHGKPAAKTAGDKSKLRVQKRKISDNRKNTSRKKRRHQCVVADIEATVGLTVAAAEAMVIAACFDGCSALHEIGTILEAAMQVKKARQMIGLDEFCTEMQTPLDLSDLAQPECLDDYSLHEALADVGIYEVLEDKGMPAPICANVEDNHEVLQQKGKESTIDTKRPSCNYEQNEEHILLLHHDCAAESSSYKLDLQFANTRQAKISYSSEFNLERSCSDIQHQLANVQNKALQECRIDPEISVEHLATQECERNLALACEKSRSASLTKLHDKTFRAISSNSVVKWRTCSGSASPGCFRSHEQNAVCWKEEKLHTSLSNRVLNREPDANDSSYLLKPFCSRWFGGWTSTENPSDKKIQGLIKPRISQAFPEYQETSYLTESNVPQKLVNLKALCPNDDNKFIPLSLVKVISESQLPSTEEDQLIISMPEERLENLSQASGACSVSSSDDPLCSFVPCSILSPPGRLMSGTLEYDNNCNDDVPCPTPVKDIKDAEGGVKRTQSLSLRRYSTTSHCLGQLLEAVNSLCSENSKKGNRLENEGRKPISNAHCSGQDKAAHESGLLSIENTTSLVSKLPPTYMGGDNSGKGLPVEVPVNAAVSQAVTNWKAKVSELPPVHSSCEWQSSPPLLFPRGRRKRLKAGFIIDTGASNETFLEEFQGVDTNAERDLHMVPASREENIIGLTNEAENNPTESKGGFLDKQNDKIDSASAMRKKQTQKFLRRKYIRGTCLEA
ncbi:hypothetical protein O6H91_16G005000 [Diphasiastrum complanatum]|uniref:Uncharacterized protein n=1 Tax=Diphasiastrum complanatum TaxID=34168 RepID=A0ACC2B9D8_DIPCM|nr:hypothetical protein O6H91_16G005000 [Diphasiastrum complanatum]